MFVLAADLSEQLPASLNYWAQSGWRDDLLPVLAEEKSPVRTWYKPLLQPEKKRDYICSVICILMLFPIWAGHL